MGSVEVFAWVHIILILFYAEVAESNFRISGQISYKTFYNSRPKLTEMKLGPDKNRNERNMDDVKKKKDSDDNF